MKPLLVGEANPYGGDPAYALYPLPERAAGDRLCRLVMGLRVGEYLRRFDRANLCPERWSMRVARARASEISRERGASPIVLLGAKVSDAFGVDYAPFRVHRFYHAPYLPPGYPGVAGAVAHCYVVLPHPSGLNRMWNLPGAFERARATLREAGVLPPEGTPPEDTHAPYRPGEAICGAATDAVSGDRNAIDCAACRRAVVCRGCRLRPVDCTCSPDCACRNAS